MKIRTGFVANSSTSSFVIATKKELTLSLIEKKIIDYFRVNPRRLLIPSYWDPDIYNFKRSPRMRMEKAIKNFFNISWEATSSITDKDLNPISYREKKYDGEEENKYVRKVLNYSILSEKGYKYFYRGDGADFDEKWLLGIKIEDDDFVLYDEYTG